MRKSHLFWSKAWYGKSKWLYLLLPLSGLFAVLSFTRKFFLTHFMQKTMPVPVIVVGNICVGGTGKTPLIIELVKYLQSQGYKPGVVSRGYGGLAPHYPYLLTNVSTPAQAGDEPLLIYRATQCAMCVAPDRVAAALELVAQGCTHILSDDGLQHYRLGRALEIAVVDGQRLFGNHQLLPAGPLREPVTRLKTVDFIVVNGLASKNILSGLHNIYTMDIQAKAWHQVLTGAYFPLAQGHCGPLHAIAGIGNPERFFSTLDGLALQYYAHPYADHHNFSLADFAPYGDDVVLMTEKDAVKCQGFAKQNWYALTVSAQMQDSFWQAFQRKINALSSAAQDS